MTEQPLVDDAEHLRHINLQLAHWELQGARAPGQEVAAVLDKDFLFRRGNGDIVHRDGFLAGLAKPENRSNELVARMGQIQVLDQQAFVEVFVFLDGVRDGKPVKGWFRNLRVWEKHPDEKQRDGKPCWRCVFWFNKPLTP